MRIFSQTEKGPSNKNGREAAFLSAMAAVLLCVITGCAGALATPLYLIKGNDVDPEFKAQVKELPKGSTIAVICRSPSLNLFGTDNPSRALSLILTKKLAEKLEKKKFEWVSIDRVEALFDESSYANESYEKMGAKVGADYVIGVDVSEFSIHHSSQFYQGKTKVNVRLVDVETGKIVFSKSMPHYTYPPNAPPSVNDISGEDFQNIFVIKVADEIGCLFYPYNPHEKYALDNDFARLR